MRDPDSFPRSGQSRSRGQRFLGSRYWLVLKNVIGWPLILLSFVAGPLVPGPGGIPLFLIGFALISFPGKRRLTARVLRGKPVRFKTRPFALISLCVALTMAAVVVPVARSRSQWVAARSSPGPLADAVVDLTSTGSTLRVNGLREVETVLQSSAHLITAVGGPRNGDEARRQDLDELVTALASVIRARGQRYLMANVPREALDAVRAVLPGLNGPTVIDIADHGRYVAVHAVVNAATIYRTISQLRALGGEGILVTRIERLVP